ncbi:hypothetical protein PFFCH_05346 [Plasmodium falciparum FCH/4]|uniref:Erythrocyte membrane protein 1 n=1 Tax=Plasmodium falciparum FCH/4 TaxID=1036724 RepID=A0A024VH46_PLAFA|nr:hypothetical protein PFFCH_05346 [Plasmodium falciparum FCH/4]
MAAAGAGSNESAKYALDTIGGIVQKKAKNEANESREKLKGNLWYVEFFNGPEIQSAVSNVCELDHTKDTNVGSGHSDPCEDRLDVRFSDIFEGQCTDSKIRDNDKKTGGACAPFRRLHMCDRNLEEIEPEKIISTDNLLVDVLLAAKYEGESIMRNYPKEKHHNKQGICTALARSFADIGDIIRGKDLYRGNSKEKDYLQDKLKKYFQKIYDNLKDSTLQDKYKDGKDPYFYQLREDWWNANRYDVWKAITCNAKDAQYFRNACSNGTTVTDARCQCIDQTVPTNFDYVPQYLRWFEEWSEEFCRIKQLKLEKLEQDCRGENEYGKKRYCSRNGCDCEETINRISHLRYGNRCIKCLFGCNDYIKWINKKKDEFDKQKKKCENEIYNKQNEGISSNVNDIYFDNFYIELKKKYSSIEHFLNSLNAETKCKNLEEDDSESKIDFNTTEKTFSRSKYCESCPQCGVDCNNETCKHRDINDPKCEKANKYTHASKAEVTEINILSSAEEREDIIQKLKEFCDASDMSKLTEQWKCYYENDRNEACILKKENKSKDKPEEIQKSFYDFFTYWVAHLLKDTEVWRSKIKKCLKNKKQICINKCNSDCKCFEKWVEKKKIEWGKIKDHYEKQKGLLENLHFNILETVLEVEFLKDINNAYDDPKEIERIRKFLEEESTHKDSELEGTKKDVIDFFLEHELDEADLCLDNHPEDKTCIDDDEEDDDDHEELPIMRSNPCGVKSGRSRHPVLATKAAHLIHEQAKKQLSSRGGRRTLKADATRGHYDRGGTGNDFKNNLCGITQKHSNAINNSNDPCNGKGNKKVRFQEGIDWQSGSSVSTSTDVYLPPRRQHMCTSNLENLDDNHVINNPNGGSPGDSLLGDVMLAANKQAERIKNDFSDKKYDNAAACRALRYSFADLGDIIRGRDLWDRNNDATGLQSRLENIFKNINEKLPVIQGKYDGDDAKHTKLRSDWWTANRRQVWRAMQCIYSGGKCSGIPIEDYIPQRLRWMTEWAEWFCKMQSQEYDKLMTQCGMCTGNAKGQCTRGTEGCKTCEKACEEYKKKIKKWAEQWNKMQIQYTPLYLQAQTTARNAYPDADYQLMVDFFKELQKANVITPSASKSRDKRSIDARGITIDPTTPYFTAEGYIHQEARVGECEEQKHFCTSGDKENKDYVFREKPKDHDEACSCNTRDKKSEPPPKKEEPACKIVDDLFSNNTALKEACALKYGKKSYFGWNCNSDTPSKSSDKDNGSVCIPPRRQQMYTQPLQNVTSPLDLRNTFIEMAAIETFFQWHKFKKEKEKEIKEKKEQENGGLYKLVVKEHILSDKDHPQKKLKKGDIPDEFKRQMFYTFGDYRDICLGKDIGNDVDEIEKKIKDVFTNGDAKDDQKRKNFWDKYGKDIWDGMLCALSYDTDKQNMVQEVRQKLTNYNQYSTISTTLEDFVTVPQFLRWFTEWGEEFCRKQKDMLKRIKDDCRGKNNNKHCSGEGYDCELTNLTNYNIFNYLLCPSCEKECTNYKKWIENKKKEFNEQNQKYEKEYKDNERRTGSENNIKTLYYKLKRAHKGDNSFFELFNNGPICKNIDKYIKKDYNDPEKIFSRPEYCKTCPIFDLKWIDNKHNSFDDSSCRKIKLIPNIITDNNSDTFRIDILVDDDKIKYISGDTQNHYKNCQVLKNIRTQEWECKYKCNFDVCETKNFKNDIDDETHVSIEVFIKRWLVYFLTDYSKLKKKLNQCMNDENNKLCIKDCKNFFECVEKWIRQKKNEWEQIKDRYLKQYKNVDDVSYHLIKFLQQGMFTNYVKNVLDKDEDLETLEKSDICYNSLGSHKTSCERKDVIQILLNKLQDKITSCQNKHNPNGKTACDETLPHSDEEENLLDDPDAPEDKQSPEFCMAIPKRVLPETKDACDIVHEILNGNNGTTKVGECNPKTEGTYPRWKCGEENFKAGEHGACMPPRRQKLCIHNLEHLSETSKNELRKAFIECAAIETFWLWHKYKDDKKDEKKTDSGGGEESPDVAAQNQLESGTIPEEFKRQMYYTFGDYRDLCLDKDIGNDSGKDISATVTRILSVRNDDKQITAEDWWETNGPDIWKGMVCGLSHHIKNGNKEHLRIKLTDNNKYSKVSSTLEDFAKTPQFLRWFTEWADQFCRERVVKIEELKNGCNDYKCENTDEDKKQACKKACEDYKKWLTDWKDQYEQQTAKFDKDKEAGKYEDTSAEVDVHGVSSVHEYLQEQLQKLCKNNDCACMKKTSTKDEETELLGENYFPEAMDYPPKEIGKRCKCAIPSEPMSCVEQIAKHLRKKAEKNVKIYESSLKGTGNKFNGTCNLIEKQNSTNGEYSCEFEKLYPNAIQSLNVSCDNNGKERFKIEEEWKCEADTTDGKNKLCVPPRRKSMCLKKLQDMSVKEIRDSKTLLEKIQEVAKNEGDDIIKNLLPKYPCNESVICDAMKYSFADIGDIIRGRSKIKPNNGDNIEGELHKIFTKIQNDKSLNKMELTQFREKWWDANRKHIWNAMTCNAPKDAKLNKRSEEPEGTSTNGSFVSTLDNCGYNKEPPDYDYIPERYRFLQEWSEYYCKALKEKNNEMEKECPKCLKTGKCENENNKENCKECIRKCKDYSKFVDKWKAQFDQQNEIYKTLYIQDRTHRPSTARRNPSIKFTQKLDKICENPDSAEKYLDISTHCTDYKFSETNSNESSYAFSEYPMGYKAKCNCNKDSFKAKFGNTFPFIRPPVNIPNIPGLNTIKKAVAQIPKRIKNISPDAHTIHAIVARSFDYFVPLFQEDDKTPPTNNILNDVLPSAIPVGIALALTSIAFLYLKKKTKASVGNLFQILQIPKSDYDIPTKLSPNRYIPYTSGKYRGKRYIYLEGDSGTDSGYTDHYSDITSSSESEYEELDINDIYVPGSPKYKTLIEVVLEPSGNNTTASGKNTTASGKNTPSDTQNDIQNDGIPSSKITDNEWNTLKDDFISQYLQSEQPNDIPNDYKSGDIPFNTQPNTLYFDNNQEKPFIMFIQDRNLYSGEENNYNVNMVNSMDDIPINRDNNVYSGIDLINDTLSGNEHIDIYDEVLKRKENELFGTENTKRTSTQIVTKSSNSDPIINQLNLFHTWLDRHRDMCEKWNNKEDILNKLNEEWNKDNDRANVPNDNKTLNTDVSIQIDMDHGKPKKEFTNMDTILEDLDKYNEPYYDVQDDIYYDVNDHDTSTVDSNAVNVPSKVQIEMDINTKLVKEKYPISDVWDI